MISLIAFVVGAVWGGYVGRKRGGNLLDILQYAVAHGILFALLSVAAYVLAGRMNWI